ncbi:MAG: hypothetical protein LIQ30_09680 [Planctomycetes bacterium]|nr:hypothetical protein [Planctomycetota bacterium]MCC8115589.1 hypothetical protein [Planctomycetota bacterium]MCD7895395.1 hypothetical protein [Planctomycetaceae bacterium]
MSMALNGFSAQYSITSQTTVKKAHTAAQSGVPTWDPNRVWGSIGGMEKGFRSYRQQWNEYYSESFAAAGSGVLTQEELTDLLQSEFGGMGVTFIDHKPGDAKAGRHDVYIDDVNRQKMASDPEYRARMMSVIQMEMAGVTGYSLNDGNGTVSNRLSGTVLSMAEGDPLYEGVPHSGGAVSESNGVRMAASAATGESKGKGLMTLIIEKMQEMMEERRLRQEREKQLEGQGVQVEISVEARSLLAGAGSAAAAPDAADAAGNAVVAARERTGALDIVA